MPYKTQQLSLEKAKENVQNYPYALVYQLETILVGSTEQIKDQIRWEECLEARFFSSDKELHLFDWNGELRAVLISDGKTEEECQIVRTEKLKQPFTRNGWTEMVIKEYIAFDEDGQAYVALTRLAGLK